MSLRRAMICVPDEKAANVGTSNSAPQIILLDLILDQYRGEEARLALVVLIANRFGTPHRKQIKIQPFHYDFLIITVQDH